jgi:hypothetical protein
MWNLNTGSPLGDAPPVQTGLMSGVATVLLPDNRPTAVTRSSDQAMRVWDLGECVHVLPSTGHISHLAAAVVDDRPCVVAVGDGITALHFDPWPSASNQTGRTLDDNSTGIFESVRREGPGAHDR